jgi:hypothetical protein
MNACLANCAKAQHDLARSQASHRTGDSMQRISKLAVVILAMIGLPPYAAADLRRRAEPAFRYQKSLCQPDRKC